MSIPRLLRILIVSRTPATADELAGLLRGGGLHLQETPVADEGALQTALAGGAVDLVLHADAEAIDPGLCQQLAQAAGTPTILLEPVAPAGLQPPPALATRATLALCAHRELYLRERQAEADQARAQAHELTQRLAGLLGQVGDGVALVVEGVHVELNDAYAEALGQPREALLSAPAIDLVAPADRAAFKRLIRHAARPETPAGTERQAPLALQLLGGDGQPRAASVTHLPHAATGALQLVIARAAGADTHPATGLPYRWAALERWAPLADERLLALHWRGLEHLVDDLGPADADAWLAAAGGLLRQHFGPPIDWVQVDETRFVGRVPAEAALEPALEALEAALSALEPIQRVRLAAGFCQASAAPLATLVRRALVATAGAEESRGRLVDGDVAGDGNEERAERLRRAVADGQLHLACQPIEKLGGGMEQHLEVRSRLREADGRERRPSDFLPLAEAAGLMPTIDRAVITQAAARARAGENWYVKLAADTLADPAFPGWLGEVHWPAESWLHLQVDERVATRALAELRALLTPMRRIGATLVLDEFGSGERSLDLLAQLQPSRVRLAGALVAELGGSERRVAELIARAEDANAEVMAGRVENAATLATLWRLGVHYVQGNYLREPEVVLASDAPAPGMSRRVAGG
ncbi:MAG: EAL domain-containing protein [Pseudomonadota bacterium]|nr:EAL domain-containing protein [Pseudomonadota bacterium]